MKNKFDIVSLAKDWQEIIIKEINHKEKHPVQKYQPTRAYKNRKVKTNNEFIKLNIACGPSIFPYDNWINIDNADFSTYFNFIETVNHSDGMPEHQKKLWEWCRDGNKIEYIKHDMTKPFTSFNDESVDYIYVGQAIEHLNPIFQAPQFLKECFRMMKKNAILRMTTPDLDKLLDAYKKNEMNKFNDDQPEWFKKSCPSMKLSHLMFGAGGKNSTQINYEGHQACYTRTSMDELLSGIGFKNINFNPVKREEIRDEGLSHSLVLECQK